MYTHDPDGLAVVSEKFLLLFGHILPENRPAVNNGPELIIHSFLTNAAFINPLLYTCKAKGKALGSVDSQGFFIMSPAGFSFVLFAVAVYLSLIHGYQLAGMKSRLLRKSIPVWICSSVSFCSAAFGFGERTNSTE